MKWDCGRVSHSSKVQRLLGYLRYVSLILLLVIFFFQTKIFQHLKIEQKTWYTSEKDSFDFYYEFVCCKRIEKWK